MARKQDLQTIQNLGAIAQIVSLFGIPSLASLFIYVRNQLYNSQVSENISKGRIFSIWFLVSLIALQIMISFCVAHFHSLLNIQFKNKRWVSFSILIVTLAYTIFFVMAAHPYLSNSARFVFNWFK